MIILHKNEMAKVYTEISVTALNQANEGIMMVLLSVESVQNFNFLKSVFTVLSNEL